MTKFRVKVISDTVCPWCYLGKRRLEKAIAAYKKAYPGGADDTFEVSWFPYYLDKNLPKVGESLYDRWIRKYGEDRTNMIMQQLKGFGDAEGVSFTFRGKVGHTRDSHRVIQLAKTKGIEVENDVVEAMFRAYFEENGDITAHDVLIEAGSRAGLDSDEIKKWLDEDLGGEEVDREVEEANELGLHGVPYFTISEKFHIDGCEELQVFIEELIKAKKAAVADGQT